MSLEKDIQDLTQALAILVKSVDLNTAVLSELSAQQMQPINNARVVNKAEAENTTKAETRAKAEAKPTGPTDEQIKATKEYNALVAALKAFSDKAEGNREKALKELHSYSPDGSVIGVIRQAGESGSMDAYEELMLWLAQDASEPASEPTSEDDKLPQPTDEDVREALRKFAAVEGRPAAVQKLKELTGGKAIVKDIPADMYAVVIEGLSADF